MTARERRVRQAPLHPDHGEHTGDWIDEDGDAQVNRRTGPAERRVAMYRECVAVERMK